MAITETEKEVYRLAGRVDGHDAEIQGMRGQIADIHSIAGGFDAKLDRLIINFGSGPQRALTQPQEATEKAEPTTDVTTKSGAAKAILNSKNLPHLIWGLVLLLSLIASYAVWSGRPASDFMPSTSTAETRHRSAIGPLERNGAEITSPSAKPTTRENSQP